MKISADIQILTTQDSNETKSTSSGFVELSGDKAVITFNEGFNINKIEFINNVATIYKSGSDGYILELNSAKETSLTVGSTGLTLAVKTERVLKIEKDDSFGLYLVYNIGFGGGNSVLTMVNITCTYNIKKTI